MNTALLIWAYITLDKITFVITFVSTLAYLLGSGFTLSCWKDAYCEEGEFK